MTIEIRPQKIKEAKSYYNMLNNPNFRFFPVKPETIKAEKDFLRKSKKGFKNKTEFNFSIYYNNKHVGAVGAHLHSNYKYICEAGYFVDEKYWGQSIATEALKQLEIFITRNLSIKRIELIIAIENQASKRVAQKSGYFQEGILRQRLLIDDNYYDCYIFSKIF